MTDLPSSPWGDQKFNRRAALKMAAGFGALSLLAAWGVALPAQAQRKKTGPTEISVDELMKPGPLSDLVLGNADAPITVVEYASMTCGHCAHFHTTVFPTLKEKYVDTGKVRFVMREFPLDNLAAAASMFTLAPSWATCIDIGGRHSGVLSAAMNTSGQVGGIVSPILLAYVVQEFSNWAIPPMTPMMATLWNPASKCMSATVSRDNSKCCTIACSAGSIRSKGWSRRMCSSRSRTWRRRAR